LGRAFARPKNKKIWKLDSVSNIDDLVASFDRGIVEVEKNLSIVRMKELKRKIFAEN